MRRFAPFLLVGCLVISGCGDVGAMGLSASDLRLQDETFAYYLSRPPVEPETEQDLLEGLTAAVARAEDDPAGAAFEVERLLAPHPVLDDWRPVVMATLWSRAADTARTRMALAAVPPEWHSRWGWDLLIDAHERAESPETAREVMEQVAALEASAGDRAEYRVRAAEITLELGDTLRATEELWSVLTTAGRSGPARSAARILDDVLAPTGADLEIPVGRLLLSSGSLERAHERLRPYLDMGLFEAEEADEIRAALGRGLVQQRRYSEAAELLRPLFDRDEASGPVLDAIYWTGRSQLARGAVQGAADSFWRLAELAPQSSLTSEAMTLLLEEEMETGFGPRARTIMDQILDSGVRTNGAEEAVVKAGTSSYLSGDYETASNIFGRYLQVTRSGESRQRAAYWSALASEQAGDLEMATALWEQVRSISPYSFYGLTAAERTGEPVLRADLPPGPEPVVGLESNFANALLRLRVLRIMAIPGALGLELDRLTEHFLEGAAAYELAEALIDGGFAYEGAGVGWDIQRTAGGWNVRLLRVIHPFPYRDLVISYASERDLDPFVVAGLIRQESVFHATIVSSAGAVGLMQLMPATAREVAADLRIGYSPEILGDPETNIRMGTTYLYQQLSRFDGRLEDALAAYNAGPGRALQWKQTPEYRDRDVFMEWIPFEQTRNYVKLVQQHARMYTALYGCGDFDACLGATYQDALAMSSAYADEPLQAGGG